MLRLPEVLLLSLLALPGCGVLATDAMMDSTLSAVQVETDARTYQRAATESEVLARISFMVSNRSGQTVSLARCGDRLMTALDRREGSAWVQFAGDICPGHLSMVALRLSSSGTADGTVVVREPGVYRLRLGVAPGDGQIMWSVTSNEFIVQ